MSHRDTDLEPTMSNIELIPAIIIYGLFLIRIPTGVPFRITESIQNLCF